MSVLPIRPFMFQAHPAYRAQIDLLREEMGSTLMPVFPADNIEHERWRRPSGSVASLLRWAGFGDKLPVPARGIYGYVSGSLLPDRYALLDNMERVHVDADDPLSIFTGGTRGRLPAEKFRRWALSFCERFGKVSLSFWSKTQLSGFLANLRADESKAALSSGMLSVLPPAIAPRVSNARKRHDGILRCLTVASGKFWHKGVPEAVAAVERLVAKGLPVQLTIVGADIPAEWRAWLLGRPHFEVCQQVERKNLDRMFGEHHALVFPSHHDTFGWVLLEAKSFGMPAVVTAAYNRAEIVLHDIEGFVIPDPFASPFLPIGPVPYAAAHLSIGSDGRIDATAMLDEHIDALAEAIRSLLEDDEAFARLSAGALASVQKGGRYGGAVRRTFLRSRFCA